MALEIDVDGTVTLRSSWWDGEPPAPGDVVIIDDQPTQAWVVDSVAEGPGPGQYRLECRPVRLIHWQ